MHGIFNRYFSRPNFLPHIFFLGAIALVILTQDVRSAPLVFRDHVDPHWLSDHNRFWYRNNLRGGKSEFIVVDAEAGTKKLAFDHNRVAEALSKLQGHDVAGDQLPIDTLDFESHPNCIVLGGRGKSWILDLQTNEVRPSDVAPAAGNLLPAGNTPHPSRATGPDTSVIFQNQTPGPVQLLWIDTDNVRHPYGRIEPGKEWEQSTFAGHVWLITDAGDHILGVFEATPQHATAIINGKTTDNAPTTPRVIHESHKPGAHHHAHDRPDGPVSPDGKWIAFIKDDNVFLRETESNNEVPLSHDGKPADRYSADLIWWSPDSQNLVAMRVEPGQEHKIFTVESSPKDQVQPKLRTLDYLKPGDRIDHPHPQLFHIAVHEQIPINEELFPNPWAIEDLRWAADGSRFMFVYNQRGHQVLRVIAIDAATGHARTVVDENSETFIDYSGKYFCHWVSDNELIWMSERDGWNHLWLYDAAAGKVKNQITRGEWVVQDVTFVDEANRQIWFKAGGVRSGQDPYYTHFCRVNFDGTGLVVLTEGDGTHRVSWAPGDRFFVNTWSRVDQPPITELRRSDSGQLVCKLEEADAADALAANGGRWPEPFATKGRNGTTDIYGYILFPRDFDPAEKYPVVEEIYAGPHGYFTPKSFRADFPRPRKITDRGMILVQCDGMGTSGRSKKFHDVCWKNLRDAGFPDRIAWIKAAAEKHPQMDLSRVGIFGGSAGGQSAMAALLWHNEFYKVAVADCGCHDNRMDKIWWNEQWMGWPIGKQYEENSNVTNAHLLQGKLMLIVGELDDNVDPSSTMQVVNALEKANKDFELVIVTGAHHGAAETPYGSRRRLDFLVQNLLSSPTASGTTRSKNTAPSDPERQ